MDYNEAISGEFQSFFREIGLVELLLSKSDNNPLDDIEIRAAALSLSTIYNGVEKVIEFALKDQNVNLPTGGNWHALLLETAEQQSLIHHGTRTELLEFMAFRHCVRHAYSFEIDHDAITEILRACPELFDS